MSSLGLARRDSRTERPLLPPAAVGPDCQRGEGRDDPGDPAQREEHRPGVGRTQDEPARDYSCTLRLARRQPTWYWSIRLANATKRRLSLDAVLAQDLGIAHEEAVRSSELYTSQYIDHTILADEEFGFLICSRQNLPQGEAFPWVMQGCLDGAVGYLTDGFQFYGLAYKASNVPAALGRPRLPNRNYQHEFALPTLQSRRLSLAPGATGEITFFAAFAADHPAATSAADAGRARAAADAYRSRRRAAINRTPRPRPAGLFDAPVLFESQDLGPADLERFFGSEWRHVEQRDGMLLSFFHGHQEHIVLKAKELVMERPTGHIMRSGRDLVPSDDSLSVTAWMFGVFGSQLTIGNTSFNKLLSVCRNPLNVLKASGQRIFVRTDRGYELLGLPSAFEMGPNDCIPGTALPVFAGGDWEDTLQPADPAMAQRLVSAWTVELAYQTLHRYRTVCDRAGRGAMADRLAGMCARMRSDFNRYLVPDGVVAGLAQFGPDGIEYFLHPGDRKTGVAYENLVEIFI
jgi:cellobiose phosphorylase